MRRHGEESVFHGVLLWWPVRCSDSTPVLRGALRRGRPAAPQRAPGSGSRVLAVAGHRRAIDEDGADARGEAAGIVVGGDVGDGRWVEDDEIREGSGPHGAAV